MWGKFLLVYSDPLPPPSTRRISPHPFPTLPYAVLHPAPPAFPPPASSTRESTTGGNAYFPFRSPRLRNTVYEDANPFKDVPFFLLPRRFILSNLRFSWGFFLEEDYTFSIFRRRLLFSSGFQQCVCFFAKKLISFSKLLIKFNALY